MDFKDRLLHNEIQHLGQIIQTLSYELILLQGFLKAEHGSKFEAYINRYASSDEKEICTSGPEAPRKRDAKRAFKHAEMPGKMEDEEEDDPNLESSDLNISTTDDVLDLMELEDNSAPDDTGNVSDSDSNYNNPCSDSDEDIDSNTEKTEKYAGTPNNLEQDRRVGRRKKKIWKFFDKITSNNRVSARCHLCNGRVSSRPARMIDHRIKCKLITKDANKGLVKRYQYATKKVLKERKKDEPGHANVSIVPREDQEESSDSNKPDENPSGNVNASTSTSTKSETSEKKSLGRGLSAIWQYFEVVTEDTLKKARCVACGQHISPKPERMVKHKTVCEGVAYQQKLLI